jgi:hypothetical protein
VTCARQPAAIAEYIDVTRRQTAISKHGEDFGNAYTPPDIPLVQNFSFFPFALEAPNRHSLHFLYASTDQRHSLPIFLTVMSCFTVIIGPQKRIQHNTHFDFLYNV